MTMDRPIQKKKTYNIYYLTIIASLVLAVMSFLSDKIFSPMKIGDLEFKTIQKGRFDVYIIGSGNVVPRNIEYIVPKSSGVIEAVNVKSGEYVSEGQVVFVIKNEDLIAEHGNQKIALAEAKAALAAHGFEIESRKLQLQITTNRAKSAYMIQNEEYKVFQNLMENDNPPVSKLKFQQSKIKALQLKEMYESELIRFKNYETSMNSQLSQYQARLDLAQIALSRAEKKIEELKIKVKSSGTIQDIDLKSGQRVEPGTILGLVSNQSEVYFRLKVSAVYGDRLKVNQAAVITMRGADIIGKVARIDPNVKGTTIDVDIELDKKESIPLTANMFVSGKIIVAEFENALYVEAPQKAIENGISIFYVSRNNGKKIVRTKVETGLLSAGNIQIISGIHEGDKIVVSDTDSFNAVEQIDL